MQETQLLARAAEAVKGISLVAAAGPERLAVYLSDPATLEASRAGLSSALRNKGFSAVVSAGPELSSRYVAARREMALALSLGAGAAAVAIAAVIAATASIGVIERRRELATLRALGMTQTWLFSHIAAEALALVVCAIALGMGASGSIAWVMKKAAGSPGGSLAIELDPRRLLAAVVIVLVVTLLAAAIPAFKAARADVPLGLGGAEAGG
jgi:ABC-type lipoprotein release transport system permease subunit